MLLSHASNQMQADRLGNLLEVNESTAPTAEGPAGHMSFTDLGGLDHLFRDPFTSLSHVVSVPLEQATTSRSGPHGGLVPSSLQHVTTAARVDGQELLAEATGSPNQATSGLSAIGQRFSSLWTVGVGANNLGTQSPLQKLRSLLRL